MRSHRLDEPRLGVVRGQELPLSGRVLLELMRAVLARGVPFRFRARGWSMAPFIRDGDVITISPLQDVPPRTGEVVAFSRPGTGNLVVHRVIALRGSASLVQGDGVAGCRDGIVPADNLVGRVTRVERNGCDVWLGLGPERAAIAWLSRAGWLIPVRTWLRRWLRPLLRR